MINACDSWDDASGLMQMSMILSKSHSSSAFSIVPTYLNCYRTIVTNVVFAGSS